MVALGGTMMVALTGAHLAGAVRKWKGFLNGSRKVILTDKMIDKRDSITVMNVHETFILNQACRTSPWKTLARENETCV